MTDPRDDDALPPELDPRRGQRGSRPEPRPQRPGPATPPTRGTGRGRSGGGRTGGGNRRAARIAKVLAAALSVAVLGTSGALWGFYRDFAANVTHISALPSAGNSSDVDGQDQNILLVGNDSRGGLTPAELKAVGTQADPGLNTDTMLLVHIPANGRKATAVSLPRDSYVDIPGVGMHKLNSAYADGACPNGCGSALTAAEKAGGARRLIQTVSQLSGVHIDHYVEVGLIGFYRITNVLGGVQVCLRAPAKDHYSGIDLPAGRQTIKGTQALAFVRQRHGLPGGDLDRIRRQQVFLGAVADKVLSADTLLNPFKLKKLLDAVSASLTIDDGLDLVKLSAQMRDLAAGNVTFTTMPTQGSTTSGSGQDVLQVSTTQVRAFFRTVMGQSSSANGSTPKAAAVPRGRVAVQVQNGAGVAGLATRTRTALSGLGFTVTGAGNADRSDYSSTEIHYSSAQAGAARTLAAVVPNAKLVADGSGSTLRLVLGSDFTSVSSAAASTSAAAPSSSAASTGGQATRTAADTSCVN